MEGAKKIYIVDDEVEIVDILKSHFQKRDFQISSFYSGEDVVAALEKELPDLILLDYKLAKEMTGLDLVKKLRQINSSVPVIFLTGILEETVKKEAEALGVKVFLTKPILMSVLDEVIQQNI